MTQLSLERQRRGLTQRQVSERIALGFSSYSKIERGTLKPGAQSGTARKLEEFFGRKLTVLLSDL